MEKEGQKKTKYRLGNGSVVILVAVSVLADLFTLIPFVGDFISPIYWICASFFFWKTGLGIVNWKRFVPTLLSFVGELIPVVQEFPTILAATAVIIVISRFEDKTGMSMTPVKSLPGTKKPLNIGGERQPQENVDTDADYETESKRNPNLRPLVSDGMRMPSNTKTS